MRVHFIAVGGSIMHNMAIAMHKLGHDVTGSDDIIYDPARGRLKAQGLLPESEGWDAERISSDLDLVIVGMHAHADNPELLKAQALDLDIQSFPEYLGNHAADKITVAVCGSHGKTTTTSMIMHILRKNRRSFDYAVGAAVEGFTDMVRLSDAPLIVIEGDEYLSSPLDSRPKFLHYDPDIAILTGLAWDHINVFPSYEDYLLAFKKLLGSISKDGVLIYNQFDDEVSKFVKESNGHFKKLKYSEIEFKRSGESYSIRLNDDEVTLHLYGVYNIQNLMAAWRACKELGLSDVEILGSLRDFKLPDKRMDTVFASPKLKIYKDYAHAPSKVRASIGSFVEMSGTSTTVAVLELHTYSSLNRDFIPLYKDVFKSVDHAILYFNPRNLTIKRLPEMKEDYIRKAFDQKDLQIVTDVERLKEHVKNLITDDCRILLMSSSNFGGIVWEEIIE
ncbi:MAG: Mur ligase family protein [Saprospiraceae bacterium]|nr:Mur ligase family protein [Saprospiraceae bacterium]